MAHPLAHLLDAAARGEFLPADGRLRVLPPLAGAAEAMLAFTGSFVVTGDLDAGAVERRTSGGDLSVPLSGAFLAWVGEKLGSRPATHDVLLVTIAGGTENPPIALEAIDPSAVADHPRVRRAARYRHDLRVFAPPGGSAVLVLGRGVTNRWEIAFEVDGHARGRGIGRAVATAARTLLPPGTPIWAQVAPGNAASLRTVLAGGFRPVGAEVLFPRAARS